MEGGHPLVRLARTARRSILAGALVALFVLPALLIIRKHFMGRALEAYLAEAGFTRAADCEADLGCFDGRLADGTPARLMLATRWSRVNPPNIPKGSGIAQESYVGVQVALPDEAWLARWQARIDRHVVAADASGGQALIVFRGLHDADVVAACLAEVAASLPAAGATHPQRP